MWCENGKYFALNPVSANTLALSVIDFALHKHISVKPALHSAHFSAKLKIL